jgi:hypothetical protein
MPSWAGGWDNTFGAPYALLNETGAAGRNLARLMHMTAQRDVGAVMVALNGVAPGQTATVTHAYVQARQTDGLNFGGQVPIVQTTLINRITTPADVTQLNTLYKPTFAPTVYPVEKSGNSGGGKLGTVN